MLNEMDKLKLFFQMGGSEDSGYFYIENRCNFNWKTKKERYRKRLVEKRRCIFYKKSSILWGFSLEFILYYAVIFNICNNKTRTIFGCIDICGKNVVFCGICVFIVYIFVTIEVTIMLFFNEYLKIC